MVHRYRHWSDYGGGYLAVCVVRLLGTSWLSLEVLMINKQKSVVTLAPQSNKVFSGMTKVSRLILLVITLDTQALVSYMGHPY